MMNPTAFTHDLAAEHRRELVEAADAWRSARSPLFGLRRRRRHEEPTAATPPVVTLPAVTLPAARLIACESAGTQPAR
ncbi:MAG: hypothetical protein QOI42_944 [Frankiaceae bacterium]|nr:hypothetical protein [Frankiaceae bacterium]